MAGIDGEVAYSALVKLLRLRTLRVDMFMVDLNEEELNVVAEAILDANDEGLIGKPVCSMCDHDEWTHNLHGDGRCIPECGCRAFRTEGGIGHVGRFVMPSGEWECDDDCPHLSHERPEA